MTRRYWNMWAVVLYILAGTLSILPGVGLAEAWADTNETVTVQAKEKDNPQENPADIEGHFSQSPNADKDAIIVTNDDMKFGSAGVYNDPVHDGALLSVFEKWGPVKVHVEGREGIGAIYLVIVIPIGDGEGDPPPDKWADVEDIKQPGALVLKDTISGRHEADLTDTDDDTPTLYCSTEDGKGEVEFWLLVDADSYNWTIKQGGSTIANGTLSSNNDWKASRDDLDPGLYRLEVTKSGDTNFKRRIDFAVVAVNSITVIDGATQNNVTGDKNWAAVKGEGNVIVEVTLTPNTDAAASIITWTGGTPVVGHPRRRQVSKANSAKTTVRAEVGSTSAELDVWVIWATVTIKMDGTTPPNAVQFGDWYDKTENLGAVSYNGGTVAVGKVVPIAQLSPEGVKDVVKEGWGFKREKIWRICRDGTKWEPNFWQADWNNDTSAPVVQMLTPDDDDKIYDRDAPNVAQFGGVNQTNVWLNLRQWVEWNGEAASDKVTWSWRGRWDAAGNPEKITIKEVSAELLDLPEDCN